jgi:hypothetical protein
MTVMHVKYQLNTTVRFILHPHFSTCTYFLSREAWLLLLSDEALFHPSDNFDLRLEVREEPLLQWVWAVSVSGTTPMSPSPSTEVYISPVFLYTLGQTSFGRVDAEEVLRALCVCGVLKEIVLWRLKGGLGLSWSFWVWDRERDCESRLY